MECNPLIRTWKQSQSVHCLEPKQRCMPFLVWLATTGGSLRGLHVLHSHSVNIWLENGPAGSQEWVSLSEDALKAFEALKQACLTAPILAFTDYTKPFLLETNVSKDGLGSVLLQKQADMQYHPVTYGSRALMPHKKNYHSTKLEFLSLKWAVTEHFKEYLPYEPFLVRTDNNPLTYIMMTPNLDAVGHQWVGAFVQFNFELEYQKGSDNTMVDALTQVTTWLDPDTVRSTLNGVTLGTMHWAEVFMTLLVEGDHHFEQEVHIAAGHTLIQMHVTGLKPRKRSRCWAQCWTGWRHRRRKIWRYFWQNMPAANKAGWSYRIDSFYDSSGGLAPAIDTRRWDQRSPTLCGPKGPSCCQLEWVPQECGSSGTWPYLVFIMGAFLVARYGQPDVAVQ